MSVELERIVYDLSLIVRIYVILTMTGQSLLYTPSFGGINPVKPESETSEASQHCN